MNAQSSLPQLLDDACIRDFIINGYTTVHPSLTSTFHQAIYNALETIHANGRLPDNSLVDDVPELASVLQDQRVRGALISLLGPDVVMHPHRHCHQTRPGDEAGTWHQEDVNSRHHQIRRLFVKYYPQAVEVDMGPTVLLPGTHFRNMPSARMASYGNFRGQVPLVVPEGAVVIAHFDLWHCWLPNRSSRNRYMVKFLFDRVSEPTAPSWDHDEARVDDVRWDFVRAWLPHDSGTDHIKQVILRLRAWNWMRTGSFEAESGESADALITYFR